MLVGFDGTGIVEKGFAVYTNAKAFKAHSEHGVVFNPSSAFPQSIRQKWLRQYSYGVYYKLHK